MQIDRRVHVRHPGVGSSVGRQLVDARVPEVARREGRAGGSRNQVGQRVHRGHIGRVSRCGGRHEQQAGRAERSGELEHGHQPSIGAGAGRVRSVTTARAVIRAEKSRRRLRLGKKCRCWSFQGRIGRPVRLTSPTCGPPPIPCLPRRGIGCGPSPLWRPTADSRGLIGRNGHPLRPPFRGVGRCGRAAG
jgi:hypothetical protein